MGGTQVDYRTYWSDLPDDPAEILFRLLSAADPAKSITALVEKLRGRYRPPAPFPCVICGAPVDRSGSGNIRRKVCSRACHDERERRKKLKSKLSRLVAGQGYPAALAYLAVAAEADGAAK